MYPDYFRNVLAPGLLAHQKAFHLGALHYHFTTAAGMAVVVLLVAALIGGSVTALLRSK